MVDDDPGATFAHARQHRGELSAFEIDLGMPPQIANTSEQRTVGGTCHIGQCVATKPVEANADDTVLRHRVQRRVIDVGRDDCRPAQPFGMRTERLQQQRVVGPVEARRGEDAVRDPVRVEHGQVFPNGDVALRRRMPVRRERPIALHDVGVRIHGDDRDFPVACNLHRGLDTVFRDSVHRQFSHRKGNAAH